MKKFLRFIRYGVTASLSAISDWVLFSLLVSVAGMPALQSVMIARILGGVVSFLCNRNWTWQAGAQHHVTVQGRRFLLLYGISYITTISLFSLASKVMGIDPYWSKLFADATCFALNFVVMHLYVFNKRDGLSANLLRVFSSRPARPQDTVSGGRPSE